MTLRTILWSGRRWIFGAVFLFFAGVIAGWAQAGFVYDQVQPIIAQVAGIAQDVAHTDSPIERAWIIYRNNARSVTVMMVLAMLPYFGAFVPAAGMLGNGLLVGMLLGLGGRAGGAGARGLDTGQVLLGLLPHGIFELPAVWLGAAWAMKLSLGWLSPAASGRRWEVWQQNAKEALVVLAVIMVLLAVAAFVEGNVTTALMRVGLHAILFRSI